MKNEWRRVIYKGYETVYEISDSGLLRHSVTGKIKKSHNRKDGYLYYQIYINGKKKNITAHRLVADAYIDGKTNLRNEVNHINGDKTDNHVKNLEWVSRKENMEHGFKTGLCKPRKGFDCPNSRYTEKQIKQVLKMLIKEKPISYIANKTNVGKDTIYLIKEGKRYNDISAKFGFSPKNHKQTDFSKYEKDIISLIKMGLSNKEIRNRIPIETNSSNYNYYIRKKKKELKM